jgi:hypothetical protein
LTRITYPQMSLEGNVRKVESEQTIVNGRFCVGAHKALQIVAYVEGTGIRAFPISCMSRPINKANFKWVVDKSMLMGPRPKLDWQTFTLIPTLQGGPKSEFDFSAPPKSINSPL